MSHMVTQRRGAAVEIVALHKEFVSSQARVVAIETVDLKVAPGEFLCIVGPSGCGKSTLLRILAGLETQTSGTINVDAAGWQHRHPAARPRASNGYPLDTGVQARSQGRMSVQPHSSGR